MKKAHLILSVMLLSLVGCDHSSDEINILGDGVVNELPAKYQCDNGYAVTVRYINNDSNSVAVIDMPAMQQKLLLVNVVSASGSKYVGGELEWWTKGEYATLSNLVGEKTAGCKEIK